MKFHHHLHDILLTLGPKSQMLPFFFCNLKIMGTSQIGLGAVTGEKIIKKINSQINRLH